MRTESLGKRKNIILDPGDYYVSGQGVIISTLLGSCVSACLYDPVNKVMGMNHFLLCCENYKKDEEALCVSDSGKYGVLAMELVINGMLKLGANRKYFKAKAFGGGDILDSDKEENNFLAVGNLNIQFIQEFLDNEKIPLISADLGGRIGRIIRFYSDDYSVYVRKIKKIALPDLTKRDREFWNRSLKEQTANITDIELW